MPGHEKISEILESSKSVKKADIIKVIDSGNIPLNDFVALISYEMDNGLLKKTGVKIY